MKCLRLLTVLSVAPSVVTAIRWTVVSGNCDGGGAPYSNILVDVTCKGDVASSCAMGDAAIAEGNMYATNSFDDASVTLQACVLGYCPEKAAIDAGSLCDDWLTPTGDQECGESGTYSVYYSYTLPQNDDIPATFYWFVRHTVSIKMIVGDAEECESEAAEYSLSYSAGGIAALAIIGAAACSSRRRRRNGDDGGGDETASRFVEMGELPILRKGELAVV